MSLTSWVYKFNQPQSIYISYISCIKTRLLSYHIIHRDIHFCLSFWFTLYPTSHSFTVYPNSHTLYPKKNSCLDKLLHISTLYSEHFKKREIEVKENEKTKEKKEKHEEKKYLNSKSRSSLPLTSTTNKQVNHKS